MATMKGRQALTTVYLDPKALANLKLLSKNTRVPIAAYLREAVDELLKRYAKDWRAKR